LFKKYITDAPRRLPKKREQGVDKLLASNKSIIAKKGALAKRALAKRAFLEEAVFK